MLKVNNVTRKTITRKRKRDEYEEELSSDISDKEDLNYYPEGSYEDTKEHLDKTDKSKLQKLEHLEKEREVTLEKILDSDFSDDDKLWFIEYIKILGNTERHTEDYYRIKKMIESKYNNLINNLKNNKIINKLKQQSNNDKKISDRIISSNHSDEIKVLLYKRYEKYNENSDLTNIEEYYKDIKWIENILDIPTNIINNHGELSEEIVRLKYSLDNSLYGMDTVKESIIEAYCAMRMNSSYQKKILTLLGPPGVGKTAIAQSIAYALNLPYGHIDFCSIKDASVLIGHSQTYIGSTSGLILNILKNSKCLNPVILLDEVDKVSEENNNLHSILLQLLDKTRNNQFVDSYCPEIKIDLSKVFFIIAINDESKINGVLKDRMNIIRLNGYNKKEKNIIGRKYMLPKIIKNLNFHEEDIIFNEKEMDYLIDKVSDNEKGVRKLEKNLCTLMEKINVLRLLKNNKKIRMSYNITSLKFPLTIDIRVIDELIK
jgi:ATP-dependent Lon protease